MYMLLNVYIRKDLFPVISYRKNFETLDEALTEMNKQVDDSIAKWYGKKKVLRLLRCDNRVDIETEKEWDWWQIISV